MHIKLINCINLATDAEIKKLHRKNCLLVVVAVCSGVPMASRARGKLSFGAPTQSVHGSIDAKNQLGIKGRQKLTRALQSPAYCCFLTRLKTSYGCDVIELTSGPLNLGNH